MTGVVLDRASRRIVAAAGLVLLLAGAVVMAVNGDLLQPEQVPWFLFGGGVAGVGFLIVLWVGAFGPAAFWVVAILLRGILFGSEPGDDIWRYLWEGRVQLEGFSPYLHPPADPALAALRDADWAKINHPEVSAIYPPVTQLGLRLLAAIDPSVWLFKLAVILPDLAICLLLVRRFGPMAALVYGWNPMVVACFAGGAHFDPWFLLPLVGGWFLIEGRGGGAGLEGPAGRLGAAAVLIGLSAAIKWVTFPLLGWLVWRVWRTRGWGSAAGTLGWGLLPFGLGLLVFRLGVDGVGPLVPAEFTLKTRGAELVPWLVQQIRPETVESNRVFLLVAVVAAMVLILTIRRFRVMAEAWIAVLLVLGPSNHAWYFTWALPFAVASRNWGSILISLTGFVYFQLHLTLALTGRWVLGGWARALLWIPFLAGWTGWLVRGRRNR